MTFGTVLWTMICAIFGAAFGYILGGVIELFVGGTGLPALLAAIGFIGGAVMGILVSLAMVIVWRGAYARKIHYWAHDFGHSFKHYNKHYYRWYKRAWRDNYWSDGCAGEYGQEPYSVEDTLQELDGYLSYLEDLPDEKLEPFNDRLGSLDERLNRLMASLHR